MYVKPVSGRRVPDPEKGGCLPEEGREVEPNVYWLRRMQDGDVTERAADEPKSVKKGTEQ
jgi:hypothetical protein